MSATVFIDIFSDEFGMSCITIDPDEQDVTSRTHHTPSVVTMLDESDAYLKTEPSFEKVQHNGKDYLCLAGVDMNNANTVRINSLLDVVDASQQQAKYVAIKALVQHGLKRLGLLGFGGSTKDADIENLNIICHERHLDDLSAEARTQIQDLFLEITTAQGIILTPAERSLAKSIPDEDVQFNPFCECGSTFVVINKDCLALYFTNPQTNELDKSGVLIAESISFLSQLEELKKVIQEKTGFSNMPLGEKLLLSALSKGEIGSSHSGLYVDLRTEVNDLQNQLANNIAEALCNYASTNQNIFGGLYFLGYLSNTLQDKVKQAVEQRMAQGEGVKCTLTYLPGNHRTYLESATRFTMNQIKEYYVVHGVAGEDTASYNTDDTQDGAGSAEYASEQPDNNSSD